MRVKLNAKALEYAQQLIRDGRLSDKRGSADEQKSKPTIEQEDEFLKNNSWEEYGNWFLGVHHDRPQNTKARYEFPFGDFYSIHRSDLLAIQKKAHSLNFPDIAEGAAQLIEIIDKKSKKHV